MSEQQYVPDENVEVQEKRDWEELVSSGLHARESKDKSQWVIGDLAMEVEVSYGDDSLDKYAKDVGIGKETLKRYRTVSRAFPPTDRLYMLSHRHHMVVTALDPIERMSLLNDALENNWSVEALIIEMKTRQGVWKKALAVGSVSFSLSEIDEVRRWFRQMQEVDSSFLNQQSYEVMDRFDQLELKIKKKLEKSKQEEAELAQKGQNG